MSPLGTGASKAAAHDLDNALRRLKNNAGEAYDEFVNAFESYVMQLTVAVTSAAPDNVLNMQGQAQQAMKILQGLKDQYRSRPSAP